jgi:hypothetical protein
MNFSPDCETRALQGFLLGRKLHRHMTVPVFLTFQIPNPLLLSSTNIGLRLIEKKLKYMFKKKLAITAFLLQAQHAIVLGEMMKMMTHCLHLVLH